MKTNEQSNEFVFTEISSDLNIKISTACGKVYQKGIFPTEMGRGIKVYIYSGDHLPIHFHVKSPQRYLDAKFRLEPLELIENKTSIRLNKDEIYIINYFTDNKYLLDKIRLKFIELNPNLNYEN